MFRRRARLPGCSCEAFRAPPPADHLAGCKPEGAAVSRKLDDGLEVRRKLACEGHRAQVIDRFRPTNAGIRWEIEIRGEGEPWSVPIETHLRYPSGPGVKFWTAWADPDPSDKNWRDPLTLMPFADRRLYYGAPYFESGNPRLGFVPTTGDLFSLPLATVAEPAADAGLSIALSPSDVMLDLTLDTASDGSMKFRRHYHRIDASHPVQFALDLVAHEADWRGGLRFVAGRYPEYFNPSNRLADEMAGTAAYSGREDDFDTAKLRRMAFRTNWKASFDFPYMGLFLPPVADDESWERYSGDSAGNYKPEERGRSGRTTILQMAAYSRRMREQGFYVLNYFNVTEFGDNVTWPAPPRKTAAEAGLWHDSNDLLYAKFEDAMLRTLEGKPYYTWGNAVAMDPGEPVYQDFLLDQARRHLAKLPDSSGLCIDRLDWLRFYNQNRDDGTSWFEGHPARSLVRSWHDIMSKLAPEVHKAGKVLFCNNHTKRLDLLREVDGIFDEFTYAPASLNTTAFLGIRKSVLGWTADESNLHPDPDAYFQRHLYLGVYPMAPFPGNDHSLRPSDWVDRQYLDYGPLLETMRGKKWVLTPHAVSVADQSAKANLFEVPGGYVLPVAFGGQSTHVVVTVKGVRASAAEALHPGEERWVPLSVPSAGELHLDVPLRRGCALVRLSRTQDFARTGPVNCLTESAPVWVTDDQ